MSEVATISWTGADGEEYAAAYERGVGITDEQWDGFILEAGEIHTTDWSKWESDLLKDYNAKVALAGAG